MVVGVLRVEKWIEVQTYDSLSCIGLRDGIRLQRADQFGVQQRCSVAKHDVPGWAPVIPERNWSVPVIEGLYEPRFPDVRLRLKGAWRYGKKQ